MLSIVQTALELGLMGSLTVLALFLSYSMLGVCDLSTDGCFTLGAAVGAVVALAGHPWLSIPAAMGAGMLSGFVTALLQTRMGVDSLLAGIVVNTGLYSINIAIMGGASLLNMNKTETVFTAMKGLLAATPLAPYYKTAVALLAVLLALIFLTLFLRTRLGLAIRATGDNIDMLRASSVNPAFTTLVGLCASNALTGLSGCLLAQAQKSVNIDIGSGMVTIALASLLMGRAFAPNGGIPRKAAGAVLGAVVFRLVYALALRLNMPAFMLKLVSSVIVIFAIAGPYMKARYPELHRRLSHKYGKGAARVLELSHLSKTFNPGTVNEKRAITDLSLSVADGEFITIIGANGAGKSTLFNAIAGSFYTDSGSIRLDGEDITLSPEHKRAKVIGRLFQDPMRGTAPGMSIEENLALAAGRGGWFGGVTRKDRAEFRDRLAELDMGLEDRMQQPVGLLSGGQRQALTLMMAIINPPKLLLLDEHTAALDPAAAEKVLTLTRQIVEEGKLTCLMITHNMQSALDLGSRTLMMYDGRIVFDARGKERESLTVPDLLVLFREAAGKALDNDRMMLSADGEK